MNRLLSVIEALATPHGLDRYLELVNPMLTMREMRAEVTDVRRAGASTTLTLRPTRQWRGFEAGQFVRVQVDIDGIRRTRCYSPSSSQYRHDGRIEITVKAHERGIVSQYLFAYACRGLVVGLSQADGTFRLPALRPHRLLFVSGGSGITPVLSMLRSLVDEGYRDEIVFLHYAPSSAAVSALAELRAIETDHDNVRVVLACTRDAYDADLHGRFDKAHLSHAAPWYAEAQTYLCGPSGLMAEIARHYADKGIENSLHIEEFALRTVVVASDDPAGQVKFGDTVVDNTGETLLEQAEKAGLTPEYGCRMGICFSCTRVKTSGCTRNVRTGEVHAEPDAEIQLCISAPVGDVAIDI